MPTTAHFSPRAQLVLRLAEREARELGHGYLGTEHLLLGLIREGEGPAARALTGMGITLARARESLEAIVGPARPATELHTGRSPSAIAALEHAIADSLWRKHHYTGTEHLMFALLTDHTCAAVSMLDHLGADQYALEDEMIAAADPARDAATGHPAIPLDDRPPFPRRSGERRSLTKSNLRAYLRVANLHHAVYALGTPEAERLNHAYVGTEHMLLAMLTPDEPITRLLLGEHGLTRERAVSAVEEVIGRDEGEILGDRSMTRRLFRAFNDVVDESERTGQRQTGLEYLLNAMLRQEESAAISVLRHLGVDLDLLRSHVAGVTRPADEAPKVLAEVGAWPERELEIEDMVRASVTRATRSVLKRRAREEATRLRHARTGTAHFLLAIVRSGDLTVQRALAEAGVTRVKVRAAIEQLVEPVDEWLVRSGTYSLRTVRILEQADRERELCGHKATRQSHILLAMLADDSCTAAKALDLIGVDRAALRTRLLERLQEASRSNQT